MEDRTKHDYMTKKKKKKRRRSNGGDDDGVEFAVARILVQLRHTIAESESRRRRQQHRFRFPFDWSVKRKRSALNSPPSLPPSPPPPQQPRTAAVAVAAATASIACKSDGTSPTTPFSFISPSESDDKQQQHHHLELSPKSSIQQQQQGKKREELLEMVNELTQCGILLKQEVETERYRHKKLKAINTELKLKKNEIVRGVKLKPNIETKEIVNLIIPKFDTVNQHQNHIRHKQQQQVQQPPQQQQQKHYSLYNNNARDFAMANTRRVLTTAAAITGIPDLNVSANDAMTSIEFLRFQQHYDFRANLINKAMVAAEARKKRRQIYKAKNRTTSHK